MMKHFILLLSLFLVTGCVTTNPPPIITKNCNPPKELMSIEKPLSPLPDASLTEQQIIQYWLDDDARLNTLILEKNQLVTHIEKYCQ